MKTTTSTKDALKQLSEHEKRKFILELLTEFVGVQTPSTTSKWLSNGQMPVGINLKKAQVFLSMLGFHVGELEKNDPHIRSLTEYVAFGLITEEDITKGFGLSRNSVYRILRDGGVVSTDRLQQIQEITKGKEEELQNRKQQWQERLTPYVVVENHTQSVESNGDETVIQIEDVTHREDLLKVLAVQLKAMLPIASFILSDEFSADDRNRLRELSGRFTIFNLSNVLHGLCGEQARNECDQSFKVK